MFPFFLLLFFCFHSCRVCIWMLWLTPEIRMNWLKLGKAIVRKYLEAIKYPTAPKIFKSESKSSSFGWSTGLEVAWSCRKKSSSEPSRLIWIKRVALQLNCISYFWGSSLAYQIVLTPLLGCLLVRWWIVNSARTVGTSSLENVFRRQIFFRLRFL